MINEIDIRNNKHRKNVGNTVVINLLPAQHFEFVWIWLFVSDTILILTRSPCTQLVKWISFNFFLNVRMDRMTTKYLRWLNSPVADVVGRTDTLILVSTIERVCEPLISYCFTRITFISFKSFVFLLLFRTDIVVIVWRFARTLNDLLEWTIDAFHLKYYEHYAHETYDREIINSIEFARGDKVIK